MDLIVEPDLNLVIQSCGLSEADEFTVNVNKTDLCRQSDYFRKLFLHEKMATKVSLPFDRQTIESCLEIISTVSCIRHDRFWRPDTEEEKEEHYTDLVTKLTSVIKTNFHRIIQCLSFLCLRMDGVMDLLLTNYVPNNGDDIDAIVNDSTVPLSIRWGYWSMYGNLDCEPDTKIEDGNFDTFANCEGGVFIKLNLKMQTFEDTALTWFFGPREFTVRRLEDGESFVLDGVRYSCITKYYEKANNVSLGLNFSLDNVDDNTTHPVDIQFAVLHPKHCPQTIGSRSSFIIGNPGAAIRTTRYSKNFCVEVWTDIVKAQFMVLIKNNERLAAKLAANS